jgi:hypothetical protein
MFCRFSDSSAVGTFHSFGVELAMVPRHPIFTAIAMDKGVNGNCVIGIANYGKNRHGFQRTEFPLREQKKTMAVDWARSFNLVLQTALE